MILSYIRTTTWRKLLHTNIFESIFTINSNGIIALRNGGWKAYYGLENNCKSIDPWISYKKKTSL
jgi:hypothetical protein